MNNVVLVDGVRTPFGAPGGKLATMSAPDLGAVTIGALFKNNLLSPRSVDAVIMGHSLPAGCGPSTARKAALRAGLPYEVACTTVCHADLSGMRAVTIGADLISSGKAEVVIAGGFENMSQVPAYVFPFGSDKRVDGLAADHRAAVVGKADPLQQAEAFFRTFGFTREMLEHLASECLERTRHAIKQDGASTRANTRLVPVKIRDHNGKAHVVRNDEHPQLLDPQNFASQRPLFSDEGLITPAAIAPAADGAAALLLMSEEKANALELAVLARILACGRIAVKPALYADALWASIESVAARAGVHVGDIDLFELDSSLAALPLYAAQKSTLNGMRLNTLESTLSLGHPVACTGARMLVALAHALNREQLATGCASICTMGGEAEAVVLGI